MAETGSLMQRSPDTRGVDDSWVKRLLAPGWWWVLHVALSVGLGFAMTIAWVAVNVPRHRDPGRFTREPPIELAWQPQLAAIIVAAGVLARVVMPRTGWVIGLIGVALYLASGGAQPLAVVAAVVLATGLLDWPRLLRQWPFLLLLIPTYAAVGWAPPRPIGRGEMVDMTAWGTVFATATMLVWTLLPLAALTLLRWHRTVRERERADELERAGRNERLRLARDIHDVVGHSLSLISLQSAVALRLLDNDPNQARRSLEAVRETSKQALAEVRATLGLFSDESAPLAPTAGLLAVTALVDQARAAGADVTLRPLPNEAGIPAAVQAVAHRVVQEGITNALRHAPSSAITIDVHRTKVGAAGERLEVRVADDGVPPGSITEGNGLTGMRERVRAVGGTLVVTPSPRGFVVEASLPLSATNTTPFSDQERP